MGVLGKVSNRIKRHRMVVYPILWSLMLFVFLTDCIVWVLRHPWITNVSKKSYHDYDGECW
jgi:hypothetical protein